MTSQRIAAIWLGGALLLVLAVAGIFAATREPAELDPHTPAGVVQQYVQAVMAGDNDLASDFLAASSVCDAGDLDRTYVDPASRIDLLSTSIDGNRAHVRIAVQIPTGELMQSNWTDERTIRLERMDETWRITGIPWPLYECGVWLK